MNSVILATASPYKKALFQRLGVEFRGIDSGLDESPFKTEEIAPTELTQVLSRKKAEALRESNSEATIIGADQVCHLEGKIYSKPGNKENALSQLREMQGKTHELITSYAILSGDQMIEHTNVTRLSMDKMDDEALRDYINFDKPYDCAGSYKIESGGIALFNQIYCSDFTAIVGLPLIQLASDLQTLGYKPWKN